MLGRTGSCDDLQRAKFRLKDALLVEAHHFAPDQFGYAKTRTGTTATNPTPADSATGAQIASHDCESAAADRSDLRRQHSSTVSNGNSSA